MSGQQVRCPGAVHRQSGGRGKLRVELAYRIPYRGPHHDLVAHEAVRRVIAPAKHDDVIVVGSDCGIQDRRPVLPLHSYISERTVRYDCHHGRVRKSPVLDYDLVIRRRQVRPRRIHALAGDHSRRVGCAPVDYCGEDRDEVGVGIIAPYHECRVSLFDDRHGVGRDVDVCDVAGHDPYSPRRVSQVSARGDHTAVPSPGRREEAVGVYLADAAQHPPLGQDLRGCEVSIGVIRDAKELKRAVGRDCRLLR